MRKLLGNYFVAVAVWGIACVANVCVFGRVHGSAQTGKLLYWSFLCFICHSVNAHCNSVLDTPVTDKTDKIQKNNERR